jgi:hypothetical protein
MVVIATRSPSMNFGDGTAEAALAINKTHGPSAELESFLLIVRTGRIVTAHAATLRTGCDKGEYRRILGVSSI